MCGGRANGAIRSEPAPQGAAGRFRIDAPSAPAEKVGRADERHQVHQANYRPAHQLMDVVAVVFLRLVQLGVQARAFLRSHAGGFASTDTVAARRATCRTCPLRDGVHCGSCGCPRWPGSRLNWQTALARHQCPQGKWGAANGGSMNALPIILVAHAALFVWLMLWTLYPPLSWGWVACICLMLAYWAHAAAALRASSSSRFARQSPETSDA